MSAEGKKKRGESGVSNAKVIPFRYGGSKCDFSMRLGGTSHPRLGGSRFLHAMIMGARLPGFFPSNRARLAADEVIEHLERWHRGVA